MIFPCAFPTVAAKPFSYQPPTGLVEAPRFRPLPRCLMIRKPLFDAIRRIIGPALRQREVDAIDAAIDAALDLSVREEDFVSDSLTAGPCPEPSGDGIALI